MSFSNLGLSAPILKALHEQEYETPTAIQLKAIPVILEKKDVMAAAQTGTGKTAGFTLPILELLSTGEKARTRQVRTLILTPTRELAAQVADSVATYGKHLGLRFAAVFGGVNIRPQISALSRGVDILIATPGRLLDLYQQRAMNFDQLEMLVLDEADRMLDMGFVDDIKKIMALLPRKRQNMMFSATFSAGIRELAKKLMCDPVEISVTPANTTVDAVEQIVYTVDKKQKGELLKHLIWDGRWEQVLVFTKTKHGANRLAELLEKSGMESVAIHGNKSQGARTKALRQFKEGRVRALVATDIAARGLDIELLPHVVNFDLPHVAEDYVHRIGRTGRAGATGQAISLVSADEAGQLSDIERLIKKKLPRKTADGFEPKHAVPEVSHGSNGQNRSRNNVRSGGRHRDRNFSDSGRRDDRKDSRGEKRFDSRDRSDSRGEKRFDSRDRKDSRGEKRFDPRDRKDSRGEKRFTPRVRDDRSEDRRDDGREKRFVPRDRKESSGERRFTPRDRTDSRGEKRFTPRDRTENREDSRGEKRFTPRARTEKFAPRGDRKDSRGEKRFDSRDRRSDDRKESTRSDERKPKREFRGGAEKDFRSGPRKPGNFSRSKPRN